MDDLFTFSSQQFEMITPPTPPSQSIRKRILSNIGIKRQASLQSNSTASQARQSKNTLRSSFKKVDFNLSPLPEAEKHRFQVDNKQEENFLNTEKIAQGSWKRYFIEAEKKKSEQFERIRWLEAKINQQNTYPQEDYCNRKEKRLKSLRLAPKVLMPLSDRKLPKVFKKISYDNYLPPLSTQKEGIKRMVQSREIRETFSSQRAPVLLNYGGHSAKITKKQFIEDQIVNKLEGI